LRGNGTDGFHGVISAVSCRKLRKQEDIWGRSARTQPSYKSQNFPLFPIKIRSVRDTWVKCRMHSNGNCNACYLISKHQSSNDVSRGKKDHMTDLLSLSSDGIRLSLSCCEDLRNIQLDPLSYYITHWIHKLPLLLKWFDICYKFRPNMHNRDMVTFCVSTKTYNC
jgi:hypothetical protein